MLEFFIVAAGAALIATALAVWGELHDSTGFPVGNFGILGEITPEGRAFPRILANPSELGPWLEELGGGEFEFACGGTTLKSQEFASRDVRRLYPSASAELVDPGFEGLTIRIDFFSPLKAGDAFVCSLPVLCAEIEFENDSAEDKVVTTSFMFKPGDKEARFAPMTDSGVVLFGNHSVGFGFDTGTEGDLGDGDALASTQTHVPAGEIRKVRFLLVYYHKSGFYTDRCSDICALASYVFENWRQLRSDLDDFIGLLPRVHDQQINRYLRWYIQAAIALTRITNEHVLTMGYCELNQRDSYWTSWIHLVFWPELERRMIEESAAFQREDGKIPTTVLPVIEREDDIDINAYFNLRIARYYEWTYDFEFLKRLWPHFKHSMEYLKSTDKDGDGLLDQGSYWCDWKDVSGVAGRKAAPHFELLWLAALKYGGEFAEMLGDQEALDEYSSLYERSYEVINSSVDKGGLWTGSFYTTRWYSGRYDSHVQEDQVVGPLFGVVPQDRIQSIFKSLEPNMTPWGVRDTYPYRVEFSHGPGEYHNGGVWPFLNFADALSRFVSGYTDGAHEILKRVGEYDLEECGDYLPAEYLEGDTGKSAGKSIQGWNADYYAAVYFGALSVKMLGKDKVEIMPRIPESEPFETPVVLPDGVLCVAQRSGAIEVHSGMKQPVHVRYGVMTDKEVEGSESQLIGECIFKVVEFELRPGDVYTIKTG